LLARPRPQRPRARRPAPHRLPAPVHRAHQGARHRVRGTDLRREPGMSARARTARLLVGLLALVALLTGGAASPAGAQSEGIEVRSVDVNGFPLVRAVVAGPTVTGDPEAAFTVVEDGEEQNVDVVRLRTNDLNLVVAIDVSGSMEGEPIQQAKAAVADLLQTLPTDVPVSLVSFGESAVVQHPFSTDRASLQAAVDGLIAAGGTALFDGLDRGITQLASRGGTSAMVVLTDGADSASVGTADAIV